MSSSPFPDPITTNFIPEAWQYIDLWNKFSNFIVTYPKAQALTINFRDTFLTTQTALTQWANTAYATSEIVAWVTANVNFGTAFTSAVLQYYFGGIRVATIDPLTAGATLAIGNGSVTNNVSIMSASNTGILTLGSSGSTTTLNCPITPMYNLITIPVGAIGYRAPITFLTNGPLVAGSGAAMRSCSVTQGTWLIYFFVNFSGVFAFNFTIELQTAFGRRGTVTIGGTPTGGNLLTTIGGMTYFATSQTVNFRVRNDSGGTLNTALNPTSNCVAYRIA